MKIIRLLSVLLALVFASTVVDVVLYSDRAEARSFSGGRLFRSPAPTYRAPAQKVAPQSPPPRSTTAPAGGFGRGLAGGLLGGALGALLFGSLFGMGGHGVGLLPILLLAGVAYFLFRSFKQSGPAPDYSTGATGTSYRPTVDTDFEIGSGTAGGPPPVPEHSLAQGLAQIRRSDPDFDDKYFAEVASDVFFRIQAGWVSRDLGSYRHLLGDRLAAEYDVHFAEMRAKRQINKLDNIAVRGVEVVDAGSDGREDYVTILFTANVLDYTIDELSGAVVGGSNSRPVKFAERWSWARPVGTQDWRLEGIEIVNENQL